MRRLKASIHHLLQYAGRRACVAATVAVSVVLSLLAAGMPSADEPRADGPGGYQYFVGIVGNPSVPDISWSDEELTRIKELGVNMVQLSIAWGGKPAGEVHPLSAVNASVLFLNGPSTGPSTGPMSAHQKPSLSGSTWLARVICNFPISRRSNSSPYTHRTSPPASQR